MTIRVTWALSYKHPMENSPLSPLVSEIFSLKDVDSGHAYIQTSTLTDNKECLKLAAHSVPKMTVRCGLG